MLFRSPTNLSKMTLYGCLAVAALHWAFAPRALGQSRTSLSNQVLLDRNTPMRFKPVVAFDFGGIFLSRSVPDSQDLVFDENFNTILNANQLQGQMGNGVDTTLSLLNLFSDSKAIDVQSRYFQCHDMNSHETIESNQVIPLFFGGIPVSPTNSNDVVYDSQLQSCEVNLVARTPYRFRLLAGFRYFELDETFNVIDNVTSTSTQQIGFFSSVQNAMAGGQIGTEVSFISGRYGRVFGSFKWAFLNNNVSGTASANDSSGSPLQADARDAIYAQLLDFQIGASLSLTQWLSLYGGYQGLMASNVALALEQSRNGDLFTGSNTNPIFPSDTQWHGFKFGAMSTW